MSAVAMLSDVLPTVSVAWVATHLVPRRYWVARILVCAAVLTWQAV